ncbi:MAG: hypothetical protein KF780_11420 [Sphingomonas sp.]|nr:hypothetical protein [Sphingomonas sp.]
MIPAVRTRGLVPALAVLLAFAPASAQPQSALAEYEELTGRPKPVPDIPPALREIITEASAERLVIRGLGGAAIPVEIDWMEPLRFDSFGDGRFVGFEYGGVEEFGYVLVDRAAAGEAAIIGTGQIPAFSPDGRWFAAVEMSGSGWGNLNGVALWEVLPDRAARRLFSDIFRMEQDWRIDGWARPDCVDFSSVADDWRAPEGADWEAALRGAPRLRYMIDMSSGLSLRIAGERPGCAPEERDG